MTVAITFVAAAFGSFVAVAVEEYLSRRGSRKYYQALVGGVAAELGEIASAANARSQGLSRELPLDPPYQVDAWETLLRSREVRRIPSKEYEVLRAFYQLVGRGNHLAQSVLVLLEVSALAGEEQVRERYLDLAHSFAGPVHGAIAAEAAEAQAAIARCT